VIRLRLPALRERREDVFMLTRHFLQQSAKQLGVEPKRITDQALQLLSTFNFPGNVRQLENICHWLTVMAPSQVVEAKDLPPEVLQASPAALDAALPSVDINSRTVADQASGPIESAVTSNALSHALHALPVMDGPPAPGLVSGWENGLETEALALLLAGQTDVWDVLTRRFESKLIQTALGNTRGRRIEAAQKLGIGRNTITRKIQELGLE